MGSGAVCLTRKVRLGARRSPPRHDRRAVISLSEKAASRFALGAGEDARARRSRLRVIQKWTGLRPCKTVCYHSVS